MAIFVEGAGNVGIQSNASANPALLYNPAGVVPVLLGVSGNMVTAPRVASVVAVSPFRVRVNFTGGMLNNSNLQSRFNYSVVSTGSGVEVFISDVIPENTSFPSWVELVTSEHTDGEPYLVEVESGAAAPLNRFGIALNPSGDSGVYTGAGEFPTISEVRAISQNRVDVKFSEPMLDTAEIRNASNYSFTGGLLVTSVLDVVGDTVQLVTSDQTPGQVYTLTIS